MTDAEVDHKAFCDLLDDMTSSVSATRESIKKMSIQLNTDTKDGISLLSLKHHLMLQYLQSLVLLSAHRVLGHPLKDSSTQEEHQQTTFSAADRPARGLKPSDIVDALVEKRIVLEKIKVLESKMRYQIEKLVRLATENPSDGSAKDIINDPLAFRPNPQNLMDQEQGNSDSASESEVGDEVRNRIYRPPKIAPMPYNEETGRSKKERRNPVPTALTQLGLGTDPHMESTSGLGAAPALRSSRAKELSRMTEYEEENFVRLVMKKKDMRRRLRDEADLALGASALAAPGSRVRGGPRGVGFDDEFADVLRSVDRQRDSVVGDGYEELRQRGKKKDLLTRARVRSQQGDIEGLDEPRRKKGRFERDQVALKRVLKRKMKKR